MNKVSNSFLQILKEKQKIIKKDEENKESVNKNIEKQKQFKVKKKKVETLRDRIEINEKKCLKAGLVLGEVQNIYTAYYFIYQ